MHRKLNVALLLCILLPVFLFAQDGKLRGRVTDKESGEPLIGANVVIEGTSLGASTDLNGDYIILSIPPGTYTVRASYIGYAPFSISNIRISSNITTTVDIQLSTTAIQVEAVEIVAERPLIQRNTTNTVRVQTQEEIKNIPFRGVQNIIALEAGVVRQNGDIYMRGGRSDEVTYYLGAANITNPVVQNEGAISRQTVPIIQEAIEEIQVQAGGYTAEVGGGNAGVIRTTMRSGTSDYRASVDIQSDDFAKPGNSYFGSTSFGFRNVVATLSGPVPSLSGLRIFVAGQHNYIRDRNERFLEPFTFEGLRVDENDGRFRRFGDGTPMPPDSQVFLPGAVTFKRNHVPRAWDMNNSLQGNLSFDINPFKLRFAGSYSQRVQPSGTSWPRALDRIFRKRNPEFNSESIFGELKFTHVLNPQTLYEVTGYYQRVKSKTYDPDNPGAGPLPALTVGGAPFTPTFRDGWNGYSDSVSSAAMGYQFRRRFAGPFQWSTINAFLFDDPGSPVNSYNRSQQDGIGLAVDFTSQISSRYELKAGGRVESWTARFYSVFNIQQAMEFLYGTNGNSPRSFADMNDLRVGLAKLNINHYGYDVFGYEVDSGVDGPREPLFASAYIQNKFEYEDLILNVGARFEHFDTNAKVFADPSTAPTEAMNLTLDVIDDSKLVDAKPFNLLLPRISFSFPVTDRTVFYAMYGKYAQMPSLNQLYVGHTILSRTVSSISSGNAFLTPVGFLMRPQRTTQYEIGLRQLISDNFAFTATGFYRDMRDQLAVRSFVDDRGNRIFTAYLNEDFGTVKGLELTVELRRTHRLQAKLSYTLSDALGTGSSPNSAFGAIEQNIGRPTNFINPLDFNQTHKGAVNLDYRWSRGDGGPILEGLGASLLFTFNSGHNYTKIKEPSELGQANPWNVGIRPLIDPRSSFPAEPINASTTPWVFNVDVHIAKTIWLGSVTLELYANVLNLLNAKHVLNVFPSTGTPYDDGWLTSPLAGQYRDIPNYVAFYRAINLANQYYYQRATGNEMFGSPRQVRFGVRVEI
ncbi:MAG TPA: TonB-dependent receptor [Bacteroidota bacterium]|nr:TonB-dependent receptor [Bacteroidota bacterium]